MASKEPTTAELVNRLNELSDAVTKNRMNAFTMRVPAEPKRDADLVLSTAAGRIAELQAENEELRKYAYHPPTCGAHFNFRTLSGLGECTCKLDEILNKEPDK